MILKIISGYELVPHISPFKIAYWSQFHSSVQQKTIIIGKNFNGQDSSSFRYLSNIIFFKAVRPAISITHTSCKSSSFKFHYYMQPFRNPL